MAKIPNYRWAERQLSPCPYCGEIRIRFLPQPNRSWLIKCWTCPAQMLILYSHQRSAISAWNRRVA